MKVIALLAVLLFCPLARAADGVVWTDGFGNSSCGKWLAAKNDSAARYGAEQWLLGFVSGMNWAVAVGKRPQARLVDNDAAMAFVDHYCAANPLHTVAFAAAALVQESGGIKAHHTWKW
jgi:hypothetical protein